MSSLRLVLIGKTGSGKSKTGNRILNKPKEFPSSSQGKSLTEVCKLRDGPVLDRHVSIVDTPGLLDTSKEENEVLCEITRCIHMSAPGPHAIILVVPIGRFTAEDVYTVTKFVEHFGEELFRYIIVAFTRFDDYKRDMKDEGVKDCDIKQYIPTLPVKVKDFIIDKCHGRVIGFDNTAEGIESEKQNQQLLKLVDDIIAQNRNSCYTNADYEKAEAVIKEDIQREQMRMENELKAEMERRQKEINEAADEKAKQRIKQEMDVFEREMKIKMESENLRRDIQQNSTGSFEKFTSISSLLTNVGSIAMSALKLYMKNKK